MNVVALTRQLVDIESISGNEAAVGDFLYEELGKLGFQAEKMPVEADRFNVYATAPGQPNPAIFFSTHMDTVPPFIPSSEDATRIYGRGSCDAKGIIAAQVAAAEHLRRDGVHVGLLFLVGEERDSLGAKVANRQSPGCKFLVNGEPTENKIAVASKGALRVEIVAEGRMAHSAYPELGESAIDKLLEAINRVRGLKLPVAEDVGPCTLNIGLIEGGRAPNVIPDHARAELFIRLVDSGDSTLAAIQRAVNGKVEVREPLRIPAQLLGTLPGFETTVVSFTTDIPALGPGWGRPFLIGPGSIHVAHTLEERIPKAQILEAIEIYKRMVQQLL